MLLQARNSLFMPFILIPHFSRLFSINTQYTIFIYSDIKHLNTSTVISCIHYILHRIFQAWIHAVCTAFNRHDFVSWLEINCTELPTGSSIVYKRLIAVTTQCSAWYTFKGIYTVSSLYLLFIYRYILYHNIPSTQSLVVRCRNNGIRRRKLVYLFIWQEWKPRNFGIVAF